MKKKAGILKYTENLILIIIWIAIIAVPILVFQSDEAILWNRVYIAWVGVFPFLILFMINHFLLVPFLLFRNQKAIYLVSAVFLVIVFSASLYFMEKGKPRNRPTQFENRQHKPPSMAEQPGAQDRPPPPNRPRRNPIPFPPFINTIIISVLIIGFDSGLRMMVRWSRLEQEKTFLEKENVQNQLAFLRNQVSPHFFMNTLNNIHALIDVDSEEAKEAIIKLSKLMRHLLYDSQAERVPLVKEVEFIQSYINLMKLRFSEKVKINFNIPEEFPDKSVPPLLFTSFVENAFKHGISYQNFSFIEIAFLYAHDYLTFEIRNSNPGNNTEDLPSGIGIENSKKRLDIIYGDKYTLDIKDKKDEFILTLKIPV